MRTTSLRKSSPSGFCLINKPKGMSSFQALRPLKRKFRGYKVGHAGTLDPDATGLLIAAVGPATRLIEFVQDQPKTYCFDVIPGVVTDSYDMSGTVVEKKTVDSMDPSQIEEAINTLTGDIEQLPPVFSALKINGKRACDRVRAGEQVKMKPRPVTVYSWKILSLEKECWKFEVHCSKGTYVRSLGHDLGQILGCGAAVDNIFRKRIGTYSYEEAVSPEALENLVEEQEVTLLPIGKAVEHFPEARVSTKAKRVITNGNRAKPADYQMIVSSSVTNHSKTPYIRIADEGGELLALGNVDEEGFLCPQRVLVVHEQAA